MSFIYACQLEDTTFILADTYAENIATKERYSPYSNPLVKIVCLPNGCVVAFAGNTYLAQQCLNQSADPPLEIEATLLASHLQSEQAVDYLLCHINDRSLSFIKDGKASKLSVGYLGSKTAFEKFQELRLAQKKAETGSVEIHILRMMDGVSSESNETYSKCINAFKATLLNHDHTFGGYTVPYIISSGYAGYGTYTSVYRGPIVETEMPYFGEGVVAFQDQLNGEFLIEFWGGLVAFATYFPQGGRGHIYEGFKKSAFECSSYTGIDGYDFTHLAGEAGCGMNGAATWKSWPNAIEKAEQYLERDEHQKAQQLISSVAEMASKSIAANNSGRLVDLSRAVIKPISDLLNVHLPLDTVNMITGLLRVQVRYTESLRDQVGAGHWRRELLTWLSWVDQMKVALTFDTVEP